MNILKSFVFQLFSKNASSFGSKNESKDGGGEELKASINNIKKK